ncbi:toxin [Enterococcus casseliflavus]|uniref:ImmA/IrrE family metallo-endopeptidase n=1 Tax=Enterococcus casseliflavus TaxID=37734 RepID=UPI0023DC8809|nr:ImmA/IrrE family metallo-endopeptidase [Enterococcus casseliflavus]WEL48421.1 toxin [Enterococcus casseliflavus]
MDDYENLLDKVMNEIPVIELPLEEDTGYTGLYRSNRIYLDKTKTNRKKKVVLAEEYGHHKKTVGNIIDYKASGSWKEEWKARRFGIEILITLDALLECGLNGCTNIYECSEYLDVTPDFFEDALVHYFNKFGKFHYHRNFKFTFDNEFILVEPLRVFG